MMRTTVRALMVEMVTPLAVVVVAGIHLSASAAWAGGMPLKVWATMQWTRSVLEVEAPGMAEQLRDDVARSVAEESHGHDVDPALVLALIKVESAFRVHARSHKGARGLMQVMPRVARDMAGVSRPELLDEPGTNVRLGVTLLRTLLNQYKGELPRALAAYNVGTRRLRTLLPPRGTLREVDLRYARLVMALADLYKSQYPREPVGEG